MSGKTSTVGGNGKRGSGAQLGASTRARADPTRVLGTANAVAAGLDLTRVGILSDRELDWVRGLAYDEAAAATAEGARAAEEARRKQLTNARVARWGDTPEARQKAFLQARKEEAEEAERRRLALDEIAAQEREEERLAKVAAVELARLREDPRGRHAKSILLLHEAIRDREEQLAFQKSVKEAEVAASVQERDAMLMDQWGYTAEELQKRLNARTRNMEEKNYNLEMVLFQIQERRRARAEDKEDGVQAKTAAEEEARENAAEVAERKQRELEAAAHNASRARPPKTRLEKLRAKQEADLADAREHAQQKAVEQRRTAAVVAARQARQERFEERKQAGLARHAVEADPAAAPTFRTQDRFESAGTSFLDRMAEGDQQRVQRSRELRREHGKGEREAVDAARALADAAGSGNRSLGRHRYDRAEATASGFTSLEEEQAYLAEMRALPGRVHGEEAQTETGRKAEALRVEEIQKLQAAEKRERARREVETERENAQRQREQQAGDDARFRAYIEAQLPDNIPPVLRSKALKLE